MYVCNETSKFYISMSFDKNVISFDKKTVEYNNFVFRWMEI